VNHAGGALLGDRQKGGERRGKIEIKFFFLTVVLKHLVGINDSGVIVRL
jgi:hypothetical protein